MSQEKRKSPKKPELFPGSNVLQSGGAPTVEDPDKGYFKKARQGDQKAFKWLFDKYKGKVVSYMFYLTRDKMAAEDIAQEVFLKVFRFRESFDENSKFSSWLWAIARNACLDHLRRKKEVLLDDRISEDREISLVESIEDVVENAEIQLINESENQRIKECMNQLTVSQKEALLLRTFSELSYEEIATQLKVSLSSVKSLINRGKASLTRCIGKGDQNE